MKIKINKRHQLNLVTFFSSLLLMLCVIVLIWWLISYFDVLWYQGKGGTPHMWNVFRIMLL